MKTVIVTGAGASNPFGFPLGSELIANIKESLKSNTVSQWGQTVGFNLEHINDFKEVLSGTRHLTIDQFLEAKKQFREMGGVLIAENILRRENPHNLFPVKDWHNPLDGVLFRNYLHDVDPANLVFVTLNYDRSLEYFLSKLHRYDCPHIHEEKYRGYLSHIPVIHAHGSLGTLDELEFGLKNGTSIDWHAVKQAGSRIQIISDSLDMSQKFQAAQNVLESAERIICLGFAYHPSTLKSLFEKVDLTKTQFIGTGKKLDKERKELVKNWSKSSADLHDKTAVELMNLVFSTNE